MEIPAGTRAEVRFTLLDAEERAPGFPEDTAGSPYVARVRAWLQTAASIGSPAKARTASGRIPEGEPEIVETILWVDGSPDPDLVAEVCAAEVLPELRRRYPSEA